IFNVPRRIARVRSAEITKYPELLGEEGFCVDAIISPESSVTSYLLKLIEFPEALQVVEAAEGRVSVITLRLDTSGFMANHKLHDLRVMRPDVNARV
ncbi:hypothetical protein JYB64_25500, partial [Algoriphagus aestuarii]|nr:hypothetical protein [Algoriphagus aestuarii]